MQFNRPWLQPFSMQTENGIANILPSRGLKIIGVRFYLYEGTDGEEERKAKCIQKSLYGRTDWFYFNKGFRIKEESTGLVSEVEVDSYAFDADNLLYADTVNGVSDVKISVSAIVGANGTGKSTLVDTVIRLVNNLSAAVMGEGYVYSSAQHLHYIDNVYASLAVYRNNEIKILTCKGRRLDLTTYQTDVNSLVKQRENDGTPTVEHYVPQSTKVVLDSNISEVDILPPQEGKRGLLNDWFYTMVSNYSLYAYNYRDYIYERTNESRLAKLREERPEDDKAEDEVWLKGVFHKNDGYQTPVVIHPMRENGYINAQKVNYIGKQNLISLCFDKRDGKFPFRVINQTHHIVAFYLYDETTDVYQGFLKSCMAKHFQLNDTNREIFAKLENPIKEFWANFIGIEYMQHQYNDRWQQAWDYLTYKTIKVLWTYKQYENIWNKAKSKTIYEEQDFKQSLQELLKDNSHRTQKIRQTVSYLRFCNDTEYYLNIGSVVDVDDIYQWMITVCDKPLYPNQDYHKISMEDLLPPPFVNVVLQLVDEEHLKEYKEQKRHCKDIIPFEGLSSGERQIAYTLGNIIYHLKNIESVSDDINATRGHVSMVKYKYVNVMLDEVELYFHPDLQRRLISLLLDSIKGLQSSSICGINITLVTHSPFVLSDIPSSNILCLSRDQHKSAFDKTFAANIHDLFNNTFILPYTIGEYAQRKIGELLDVYHTVKNGLDEQGWNINHQRSYYIQQEILAKLKYLSEIIGDSYLSEEVKDMVDEIEERWNSRNIYEAD